MASTYQPIAPISLHGFVPPVSALCFDPVADSLWIGSDAGLVAAYHTTRGVRGVSFPVGTPSAIQKIVAGDNFVRASATRGNSLGSWAKSGINKWFYTSSSNVTTFSSSQSITAVANVNPELILVNSSTGDLVRQVQLQSLVTQLQFNHLMLISGSADGIVRLHDSRTGTTKAGGEGQVRAHLGGIQGLQTSGNYIFTFGLGQRQPRPFIDPLVKVYDIRTFRPLPPIPFSSGPSFIHVLPQRLSTVAIVSNQGLVNVVDASNPGASEFYQLDIASVLTASAISPTSMYMAFGDADGMVHLLSQAENGSVPLNGFDGQAIEWADTPAPLPEIEWTDDTPLNSIGLPYYETPLLSSWTAQFAVSGSFSPPPPKIPSQVLNSMRTNDNIAYASLPRELRSRRNVTSTGTRKHNGRFRSGKSRATEDEEGLTAFDPVGDQVPQAYRQVEIEYSKFGVEDFDFAFYNRTNYSGLESHILNSYTNALVQVMHYSWPIRKLVKAHIAANCPREHCLSCELGFAVRMLEDANGTNCQSSNFCKTVGVLAHSSNALELVDYGRDASAVDYAHKIQAFHRFLIDHLSVEGNVFLPNAIQLRRSRWHNANTSQPITQFLGIGGKNVSSCLNCGTVREKDNTTHIIEMAYPRKNESSVPTDFNSILRSSILRQFSHKATCQSCKQVAQFTSKRAVSTQELPLILAVNTCVYNEESLSFWQDNRNQTFLQPYVRLNGQQADGNDDEELVEYELRAVIVQVLHRDKNSHLVALVKVPDAQKQEGTKSPWHIFNDFVVQNLTEEEALSFPDVWKIPAILYLERKGLEQEVDLSRLPDGIEPSILSRDTSISLHRDPTRVRHECLRPEELPRPGTLVAIDAEFVSMQQEESELRSDGSNKVLRPARLSLARVSVLRGDGLKQGLPLIDDHIHTSEIIVDYLTEYSGIKFGDLDPNISPYTLTPLKLVYKKLRLLVDRGCIFIGHGLSKDFRIINIFVPPEQVIDTVDLYFLPSRQRRLSLRFLSWIVLDQTIQTDTHDSIEDARSALNLYNKYIEFEEEGIFNEKLDEVYKEGRRYVHLLLLR
ncbi:hypothetical protein BDN72DRAFT_785586 [Pluteus cervinus]|uniref:Uncharacterized protein n=1 Tax=Pluteus cervinus TaxID=181527 RepID=A0ACD3BEV4_9AGAR|nr:hypothetical protein BDN72DRAFT_785586 [Pluteus cervinus]